ncbi:MAG: anaerobic sulfatase maturase [Lentisphaerae bacterium GWF2_44_16]|nr:MAG: anaerobic sulfatase maturase [Lentisphaerae bacterium GWF2_44_16]
MRTFSLLVKPASWSCNLRCKYCFYLGKNHLYPGPLLKMTDDTLRTMIKKFMSVDMPSHSIGWQGGEPTLMGLDFFKKVVAYQQKFGRSGQSVSNGLQTNGTTLNDEWCKFLASYKFLVGISIDGPPEIHDMNRLYASGKGSHSRVIKGLDALKRNHVEHNVLCLVSASNQNKPLQVYNYLKDLGLFFHQYIECLEFLEDGNIAPYSVSPIKWGEFLCSIFDEWYKNDTKKISVRLFDSILVKMVDNYANVCAMSENCRQYFVVEHNGDVYPCDFYVRPELKLGNISTGDWEQFENSAAYIDFGARKSCLHEKCLSCKYLKFCAGCCQKNRSYAGANPENLSVLCDGWKIFYEHTIDRFKILADQIQKERLLFPQTQS